MAASHMSVTTISSSALSMLMEYDWPGNVRELENALEVAMNRCDDDVLLPEHFRPFFSGASGISQSVGIDSSFSDTVSIVRHRDAIEKSALVEALQASHGNKSIACRTLGVSRTTLYKWLKKYGLSAQYSFAKDTKTQ